MSISGIYKGLRKAYGISNGRDSVDLNGNGKIDSGETLKSEEGTRSFLKALVESENDLIRLKNAYEAVNAINNRKDADINKFESEILARACLIASGVPQKDINSYLEKLDHLFNDYKAYKIKYGFTPKTGPDEAKYLHNFIWTYGKPRYDNNYKFHIFIDREIRYLANGTKGGPVGNCVGETTLFTVLGIRAGLDLTVTNALHSDVYLLPHVYSRLRYGWFREVDLENTATDNTFYGVFAWSRRSNAFSLVTSILCNMANDCRANEKFARAIEYYKRAAEMGPLTPDAYADMHAAYLKIGNPDLALQCDKKAIDMYPTYSAACLNMGAAYVEQKKYDLAIKWTNKAIELSPKFALARYDLAMIYAELGNYQLAIEPLKRSLELDPGLPNTYLNLGDCYMRLLNYDLAIDCFLKGLELDPKMADRFKKGLAFAYLKLGERSFNQGNYPLAINYCNKAVGHPFTASFAYNMIGAAYSKMGDNARAIEYFKKAVQFNPANGETFRNLGIIYSRLGNEAEARKYFEKAGSTQKSAK